MYPVVEVFRSLQGEGHFVGYPCVFVRLAGCSVVRCSIRTECDEAPWRSTGTVGVDELAQRVAGLGRGGICVITGGEPTDHDLIPLVDRLTAEGMRVHLETSGVRPVTGIPIEWITVSPKTPDYVQRTGHTLKLVVKPGWDWRDVVEYDNATCFWHRYLQPLTQPDGSTNLDQVLRLLMAEENPGGRWALSTQAHKTWRLP